METNDIAIKREVIESTLALAKETQAEQIAYEYQADTFTLTLLVQPTGGYPL